MERGSLGSLYQGALLSKKGILFYRIFLIFYKIHFPVITAQDGVDSVQ
jgi:hypothetical protein